MSLDHLSQMTQYPVDRRARQPSDPGDLGYRCPRRLHLLDRRDLFVGYPPSPALLRAAPGLALSPGNLLPGVNTLSPDLGLILGDGCQNPGVEPPGW